MRKGLALVLVGASAFCFTRACKSTLPPPEPEVVITESDAMPVPACTLACANGYAFCPSSFPDGGEPVCQALCQARYGLTPATMPTVLICEGEAASKGAFVRCGGVASCP